MVYLIAYDLYQPGQKYGQVETAIKGIGDYIKCLNTTWLIETNLSAQQIYDQIGVAMDANDRVIVVRLQGDWQGWLNKSVLNWFESVSF